MSFDADLTACAAIVEKGDPLRFRCAMAAPVAARRLLFPLYAFNVEVSRAPWLTSEPMIAEMRLQWWRDVCDEISAGGPVRRHEVATPLAAVLDADGAQALDRLVASRRWDIYKDAFEDADHFASYIDATAGNLMWTAARLLGAQAESTVRDAGYAAGIAGWLRAIPALEAAGRVPLVDGTAGAVSELAAGAMSRLRAARKRRADIAPAATPAMLLAAAAGPVLVKAQAAPQRVADGTLPDASRGIGFALRALTGRW